MRIFLPLHFRAPLGGVHANVHAQARAIKAAGHDVLVMCPPGPFSQMLKEEEISVLTDDFSDVPAATERALAAGPFDLVHAQPFLAREVGLGVATAARIPLLLTIHGAYTDSVASYRDRVSLVLTVSDAIRDNLVQSGAIEASKVVTLCNGVDVRAFFDRGSERLQDRGSKSSFRIGVPTRLDRDKMFILEVIRDAWQCQGRAQNRDMEWFIAGAGTEEEAMRRAAAELAATLGREVVTFLGWQDEKALSEFYGRVDVVIAPGRCCLESMASGTPSIALGSQSYDGIVDAMTWRSCAYGNFGGLGRKHQGYQKGRLFGDLELIAHDEFLREEMSRTGRVVVDRFFQQSDIDAVLLGLYEAFSAVSLQRSPPKKFKRDSLAYYGKGIGEPDQLGPPWPPTVLEWTREGGELELHRVGTALHVNSQFPEPRVSWLSLGSGDLNSPPKEPGLEINSVSDFRVRVEVHQLTGELSVQLHYFGYDGTEQLAAESIPLSLGSNILDFFTQTGVDRFRLAFRFRGVGAVQLGAVEIDKIEEPRMPFHSVRGTTASRQAYRGKNLIFVAGTPGRHARELVALLAQHPDVSLAKRSDLRLSTTSTGGDGPFGSNCAISNIGIWNGYCELSEEQPAVRFVDEVPLTPAQIDRVSRVFPDARIVLVVRDGRACVAEVVREERKRLRRTAVGPIQSAVREWMFHTRGIQRHKKNFPLFHYEDLKLGSFAELLTILDLNLVELPERLSNQWETKADETAEWHRVLGARGIDLFDELAGKINGRFGYERTTSLPTRLMRSGETALRSVRRRAGKNPVGRLLRNLRPQR